MLQLNAQHKVFETLKAAQEAGDKSKLRLYTDLLYNQALLVEGLPIEDPLTFAEEICKLMPARKPGKLPRETVSQEYDLEYGTDKLEIHEDAIEADDVVLIVDDLIATGGTAVAQAKLIESFGAKLVGFGFLMELETEFNPRELIEREVDVELYSLVQV